MLLAFVDCQEKADPAGPFIYIELQGTVTSIADGSPISGVQIKLSSHEALITSPGNGCSGPTSSTGTTFTTTSSDAMGNYTIAHNLPESSEISAAAIIYGYRLATISVDCVAGVQTIDFQLELLPAK